MAMTKKEKAEMQTALDRATPAQWDKHESWAKHEVKATGPISSCILELRARVEALEAAALGRHGEAVERAEPDPVASLVDRVTNAIYHGKGHSEVQSRAAIREVAEWINERELKAQNDPDCLEASTAEEVVGWLRDKANR